MKIRIFIFLIIALFSFNANAQFQCGVAGDLTGDDRVDIIDLVRMIDYLYLEGDAPANPLIADCDDIEGITTRDLMYIDAYLFGKIPQLNCPPSSNGYPPVDQSITVTLPEVFPAGETSMALPVSLHAPIDVSSFNLPLEISVEGEVPVIDSFVQATAFDDAGNWHLRPNQAFSVDTESGVAVLAAAIFATSGTPLASGTNEIGTLYVTVGSSAQDRQITTTWGTIYPTSPLPGGYPEVGLLPLVLGPGGFGSSSLNEGSFAPYTPSLTSSPAQCLLSGDVSNDGQVNIVDLVSLIDYLYLGGPAPVIPENADCDDILGVTFRDLMFIDGYLFVLGNELTCPPSITDYPPIDGSVNLIIPDIFPAGETEMALPVRLDAPINVSSFNLPLQISVDGAVPVIDSFVQAPTFDDAGNWHLRPEQAYSVDQSSGVALLAAANFAAHGIPLPAGTNMIGTIYISMESSGQDRQITGSWGTIYPVNPLPNDYPEVGLLPLVVSDQGVSSTASLSAGIFDPYTPDITYSSGCCIGQRGNVDSDPLELVDVGDLTQLIDMLFISFAQADCLEEANVDARADGNIDIGDVTYLIDFLFINSTPMIDCGVTIDPTINDNNQGKKVEIGLNYDGDKSTLTLKSETDLRGLQIEIFGDNELNPELLLDNSIDLYHGSDNSKTRIGVFDFEGKETIAAGKYKLLNVDGQIDISNVIVSNNDHQTSFARITSNADRLPANFSLAQNHPNPFNPSTTISFSLAEAGHVELIIYNITGQQVDKIFDGELPAGNHSVSWEADNFASGVYFYRIAAGDNKASRKMLLLK